MKITWHIAWLNIMVVCLVRIVPVRNKRIIITADSSGVMQLKNKLLAMGYCRWQIDKVIRDELVVNSRTTRRGYEQDIIKILEKYVQFAEKCKSLTSCEQKIESGVDKGG